MAKRSARWLAEHHEDAYVRAARRDGYRSRAAYKLLQLDQRDRFLARNSVVVDLGAAPGGWSQVASKAVGPRGRVIAMDLLPLQPISGVQFIQGDFREQNAVDELTDCLGGRAIDLVISDMAPNLSGVRAVDQTAGVYLCELAVAFAVEFLRPEGALVMKLFQGEGIDSLQRDLKTRFAKVAHRKPEASRARSRELYLVAKGFRP